jgi:hypothetical protein
MPPTFRWVMDSGDLLYLDSLKVFVFLGHLDEGQDECFDGLWSYVAEAALHGAPSSRALEVRLETEGAKERAVVGDVAY